MPLRRTTVGYGAVVSCLVGLAACGTGAPSAARSPTTGPPPSLVTTSVPTAATTSTMTATTGTTAPRTAPTLGRLAGVFSAGQGFGQVEPSRIFNGGDPTGLVTDVVWKSWGGPTATGTGTSDYVGPDQTVATGTEEPTTVVAFDLGNCAGTLMYRAVEWYFPQHGMTFHPDRYEDVCTGTYVPSS